jgi:hypothetical protein
MYESNLGRWMTPDPVAGDVTNPQSLNRYTYVLNNPVNLVDPLGAGPDDVNTVDVGSLIDNFFGGSLFGTTCHADGTPVPCSMAVALATGGAGVNVTGTDTSPRHGAAGWSIFGCFADDSCGFVPTSFGFSPLDIANASSAVASARQGLGSPVDPRTLSGGAAEAYNLLLQLHVDPSDVTIYQVSGGSFAAVLTPGAFAAFQQSDIQSHIFDEFLHYPYTNGARDLSSQNSLHSVWFDPRLTNFVGGSGAYMQFHVDLDNPWTGSFVNHMKCTLFKVGCGSD